MNSLAADLGGGRGGFRNAPSSEVPVADAGRTIGALIGGGFHWGCVAIGDCQCDVLLSAADGLVTLFWPAGDAWSTDQWQELTVEVLQQARDAGANLRTNLDAPT